MFFSFFILFYFLFIQFLFNNNFTRDNGLKLFIAFFSFLLLESLRIYCQSFFGDIPNYKLIFEDIEPLTYLINNDYEIDYFYTNVELGYGVLISFFKIFSSNFDFFLLFISIFKLSVLYFFCKKFKVKIINVIPIYIALMFVTFEIGMLRQSIAFYFFLLGLVYINNKTVYIFLVTIACTFHLSAILCFLLIWSNKYVNRKIYYVLFIFALILYTFKIDLLNSVLSYFDLIKIGNLGRIDFYINEVDRVNNYFGIGFWERTLFFVIMNYIYTKLLKNNKVNKYNNLIFNIGIFAILFQLFFFSSPTILSRLRYYIIIFPALFIVQYLYVEFRAKSKYVFQLIFSSYLFLYLFFLTAYLR